LQARCFHPADQAVQPAHQQALHANAQAFQNLQVPTRHLVVGTGKQEGDSQTPSQMPDMFNIFNVVVVCAADYAAKIAQLKRWRQLLYHH
jgi:hypothetical protein